MTVFIVKLGWSLEDEVFYSMIIDSSGIVGLIIGSLYGGILIKSGRRRAAIIMQIMTVISCMFTMIENVMYLSIGRFFLGVAGGCMNLIFAKIITENFPEKYANRLGFLTNFGIVVGTYVCFYLGDNILPSSEDE